MKTIKYKIFAYCLDVFLASVCIGLFGSMFIETLSFWFLVFAGYAFILLLRSTIHIIALYDELCNLKDMKKIISIFK